MLNVQVEYAKHIENQRHNMATEEIQKSANAEIKRHNLVVEQQGFQNLQEVSRHNLISEKQQDVQLRINQGHLDLSNRTLEETKRHNLIQEQAALQQANASMLNAQAAMQNASTNAQRMLAQNSLDHERENLARLQSLESISKADVNRATEEREKAQAKYLETQNEFYDTQLLMRAVQVTSGIMPFMIGGI